MKAEDLQEEIIICRCQEVTKAEVQQAIGQGCRSLKGIKNRTEAMMGLCQGRTCRRLIERMLAPYQQQAPVTPSYRPPVRTLSLHTLAEAKEDGEDAC